VKSVVDAFWKHLNREKFVRYADAKLADLAIRAASFVGWGAVFDRLWAIFEDESLEPGVAELGESKDVLWYVTKRGESPYTGPSLRDAGLKTSIFDTEKKAREACKKLAEVNGVFGYIDGCVMKAVGDEARHWRKEIPKRLKKLFGK